MNLDAILLTACRLIWQGKNQIPGFWATKMQNKIKTIGRYKNYATRFSVLETVGLAVERSLISRGVGLMRVYVSVSE